MERNLPLEENSIKQIYLESQLPRTYVVPVYQRNYAWEQEEISMLVKDVHDSFTKDPASSYYIGTLVTFKRNDTEYEVIDGQQRLTTIYILLNALGIKPITNKLTYSARKISASTIGNLHNYPNLGDTVDMGIQRGYRFAEDAIDPIKKHEDFERFKSYFTNNVKIIHYQVPKDVDLNHYFEVMNSRGEQLEMHEIVKSLLSQHIKDRNQVATFSRIWEACSEMNVYIQQLFSSEKVFGKYLHDFTVTSFEDIPSQSSTAGRESILNLLELPVSKIETESAIDYSDKFQPIIDFPNFLLIVLKLHRMKEQGFDPTKFILDDKELLNEFTKVLKSIEDKEEFAKTFAFNLLKARYLLDNFIVHHTLSDKEESGDNPWKLQYFYREGNKNRRYTKNLSDDINIQKELVHLLSMFEVAFTAKQRKNYLFYCLMYLFENFEESHNQYLVFLRKLADKYFYDVYLNASCLTNRKQPGPNAFDNALLADGNLQVDTIDSDLDYKAEFEKIFTFGSADIPLYVFNYADYRIWKKYADGLRGKDYKKGSLERNAFFAQLGCSDFELDIFNNFYFSRTRKSLEHYYPRAKAVDDKLADKFHLGIKQINCFGNFAMIGSDFNSSGSNWDPKTKLLHYSDGKSNPVGVASLKFKIMMQMCKDNSIAIDNAQLIRPSGMEWNLEDINLHQKLMLELIFC